MRIGTREKAVGRAGIRDVEVEKREIWPCVGIGTLEKAVARQRIGRDVGAENTEVWPGFRIGTLEKAVARERIGRDVGAEKTKSGLAGE